MIYKKCNGAGCGTIADHPDSFEYLFKDGDRVHDKCRWCRRVEENRRKFPEPKIIVAMDLKISGLKAPREWQLSRDIRKMLRDKEYQTWPPIKLFVSDGERIWTLSDFRINQRGTDLDWDLFCNQYPEWDMIEFA